MEVETRGTKTARSSKGRTDESGSARVETWVTDAYLLLASPPDRGLGGTQQRP